MNNQTIPAPHLLLTFACIAQQASLSKAAAELHITQSAVSHRLRQLEQWLGTPLMLRNRNGVSLTPQGQQLLPNVLAGFALLREACGLIRQPNHRGLCIGVLPSLASRWLMARIGEFMQHNPSLAIEIHSSQQLTDLHHQSIDLAIRYGSGDWPDVSSQLLCEESVFPVYSAPSANQQETIHWLTSKPLLRDSYQTWDAYLNAAGIPQQHCRMGPLYSDSALLLQAAEAGQGIALARSILVKDALNSGKLHQLPNITLPAKGAYYAVRAPNARDNPDANQFISWLAQHMRE